MAKPGILNFLNKPKRKISIGLDHGNGFVKAKSDEVEFVLPSQLARVEEFSGETYGERTKNLKTFQTVFEAHDEQKYMWGSDVTKAIHSIKSFATEERYSKLPYKLLTKFALAELVNTNAVAHCVVVTGVPSYEKNTQLEKDLENVIMGSHVITVDGVVKTIEVDQVKVLPQPLGTLMYHYLNDEGYVADDVFESENHYSGVIDIGSGTTDLDGLKELQIQPKDRATLKKGMFDVYDEIASYIKEQDPRADVTKEKIEHWIRKKEATKEQFLYNPSRKICVNFEEAAKRSFKKLAEDIIIEVDQRWNKSHFNAIYLTGGGAKLLGDYFKNWDKDIKIVENHQVANATGFYRFAKYLQLED
jgi:plasmid segregation protein ParM